MNFVRFLIGFFAFYCCVLGVLYIFQLVVVRYVVGMYFVPVCTLYFHLLYRVFCRAKVLKFVGVQFISFLLWPMFLVVRSKNCLPSPYVLEGFYIFFSKSFMVLCFTFKFMIHCELIFV